MRCGEFKCVVNFQQVVTEATVEERYTKNVKQQQGPQQRVKCRQPSIKGIYIWKTKRVPRPGKRVRKCIRSNLGGSFRGKCRIELREESCRCRTVCSEGQTCRVAGTERTGWSSRSKARVSLVMSAGVVSNSSRNINSNSRGNNSTRSRRPKSVPR